MSKAFTSTNWVGMGLGAWLMLLPWAFDFSGQQVAENDTIALQEHPARGLGCAVALNCRVGMQDRPAASAVARPRGATTSLPGPTFRIDQGAQIVKAIRRDQSGCNQFPQASFDFRLELASRSDDVSKE